MNFWDTVLLSRDGRRLVRGPVLNNSIHLWDVNTGKYSRFKGPRGHVIGIAFSRDSQTLASWGSSGKNKNVIQFYDADTGDIQRTLQLTYEDRFRIPEDTYFDKNMFAGIGKFDPDLFVWNLVTGDYNITYLGNKKINMARFSPNGRSLAIVYETSPRRTPKIVYKTLPQQTPKMERNIVLWDVETGDHIHTLTGHTDKIVSLAFSPDGRTLASGSRVGKEKTILLWDIETGSSKELADPNWADHQHKFEATVASSLAFSPDGQILASGMKLGDILLWEITTGAIKKRLRGHSEMVSHIFFSADGQTLISASHDETILIWDLTHP